MDLQFLIFLFILWVISWIIKKLPREEKDKIVFWEEMPPRIKPPKSKRERPPEREGISPETEVPLPEKKTEITIPRTESGVKLQNLLKSKSSLKKAILIKEILDKPVSER
ncbi:MAG: hypothetical protein DRP73_05240 [Candidatus Omnitrophota bacterium]|nr:MAG: hypothetical protein DRP73_05240 [Candidatus Omnitrophota bacterium]